MNTILLKELTSAVESALNMVEGDGTIPDWDLLRRALRHGRASQQLELPDETAIMALHGLYDLASAAYQLAEDSEDLGDGYHKVDHENMRILCDALDKLDALPDDQPGYTMGPVAKATWALRYLDPAPPEGNTPAPPDEKLERLIAAAKEWWANATPEQCEEMLQQQRASWARQMMD